MGGPDPEPFVPYHDLNVNVTWEYKVGTSWETFSLFFNGKHAAINNTTEGIVNLTRVRQLVPFLSES